MACHGREVDWLSVDWLSARWRPGTRCKHTRTKSTNWSERVVVLTQKVGNGKVPHASKSCVQEADRMLCATTTMHHSKLDTCERLQRYSCARVLHFQPVNSLSRSGSSLVRILAGNPICEADHVRLPLCTSFFLRRLTPYRHHVKGDQLCTQIKARCYWKTRTQVLIIRKQKSAKSSTGSQYCAFLACCASVCSSIFYCCCDALQAVKRSCWPCVVDLTASVEAQQREVALPSPTQSHTLQSVQFLPE